MLQIVEAHIFAILGLFIPQQNSPGPQETRQNGNFLSNLVTLMRIYSSLRNVIVRELESLRLYNLPCYPATGSCTLLSVPMDMMGSTMLKPW
jgi:hypothetical protein